MAKKRQPMKVVLPLGEMPQGRGWTISTGNTEVNVWVRKARKRRTRCVPLERNPFYDHVQWRRS